MSDSAAVKPETPSGRSRRPMLPTVASIATFLTLESLVLLQFMLSNQDGLLTHAQMSARGLGGGLPLVWHFGVWSDGLMLSGLLAWTVRRYIHRWNRRNMQFALTFGLVITAVAVWSYTLSGLPEAHVVDRTLTTAGWVHAVYMCLALILILNFFLLRGTSVSSRAKRVVSSLLLVHVLVGTHMLLGLINIGRVIPWFTQAPLSSASGWVTVVVVATSLLLLNIDLSDRPH